MKVIRGRKRKWSTKTSDKATAERRARDHWRALIAEEYGLVDRQASRSEYPAVGKVLEAYRKWSTSVPSAQTRRQNANMLERVIALGSGRYGEDGSLTVLNADLVRRFQEAKVNGAKGEAQARARFSANSMLTQARAVFRSVVPYRGAGYKLPDLTDFLKAERFHGVAIDAEFRPFAAGELGAIRGAMDAMPAGPLKVAALLMLYGGLRNSEVRRAQRDWLQERGESRWIVVRVSKSARGVRWVPLSREVWECARDAAGAEWLINLPTATDRQRLVERALNDWLKELCPGRLAYDLRRQAGSAVLDAQGIEAARDFLGHKSADTTRRWYASRISTLQPIGLLRPADQPLGGP